MSDFEFSPQMRQALDAYSVPAMSHDFVDRLVIRALAENPPRPARFTADRARESRWRRTRQVVAGIVVSGLLAATAAAAGLLGKPVYVPGLSELIEVIAPREAGQPLSQRIAKPPAGQQLPAPPNLPGEPAAELGTAPSATIKTGSVQIRPTPLTSIVPASEPGALVAPVQTPQTRAERAELRREPTGAPPQRNAARPVEPESASAPVTVPEPTLPPASDPAPVRNVSTERALTPATERMRVAPVETVTEPAVRAVRTATPIPRIERAPERLRVPEVTPAPTAPDRAARRERLREHRIP